MSIKCMIIILNAAKQKTKNKKDTHTYFLKDFRKILGNQIPFVSPILALDKPTPIREQELFKNLNRR